MGKTYKLKSENIERLVPDIGFAFATDMITVEGKKVDYMERHKPMETVIVVGYSTVVVKRRNTWMIRIILQC